MYVFGPYTLVQSAVTVLSDLGFVVRITSCTIPIDDIKEPIHNIVDILRMYKGKTPTELFLQVVV